MKPPLTLQQFAAVAGISVLTARKWVKTGRGPAHWRGPTGRILLDQDVVEEWLAKYRQNTPSSADGGNRCPPLTPVVSRSR